MPHPDVDFLVLTRYALTVAGCFRPEIPISSFRKPAVSRLSRVTSF